MRSTRGGPAPAGPTRAVQEGGCSPCRGTHTHPGVSQPRCTPQPPLRGVFPPDCPTTCRGQDRAVPLQVTGRRLSIALSSRAPQIWAMGTPRGGCSQHAPSRVRAPPLPSGPFSSGHACLRPALPHGPCSRVRGSSARVRGSVRSRCLSGPVVLSSFVFFFLQLPQSPRPPPRPRAALSGRAEGGFSEIS